MSVIEVILILIIVSSVALNGTVIIALLNRWSRLQCQDIVLLFLSICDFCQSIIEYPMEITANVQTENIKCIFIGYSYLSLACISIGILTSLSIGRMLAVTNPFKYYLWMQDKLNSLYFIIPTVTYGIICGSLPLTGWSKYAPELQSKKRCSVNINDRKIGTITCLYFITLLCYTVPVTIMVCCFIKIRKELRKRHLTIVPTTESASAPTTASYKADRRFSILVFFMIITFLLAWSPYALVVFLSSLGKDISLVWGDVANLIEKSSVLFNPIIYALLYKKFRKSVTELFGKFSSVDIEQT